MLGYSLVYQEYGYNGAQMGVATDTLWVAREVLHADKDVACLTDSGNAVL